MDLLVTLKIQRNPSDINEGFVKEVIEDNFPQTNVERTRSLENGVMLVTVSLANERVLNGLYNIFPLANGQLKLDQTWVHYPNTPSIVLLRDPPPGTNEDKLESYLDGLEIDTEEITFSQDEGTFTIELTDSTDLPFLVTKTHTMKRQRITFYEASTPDLPNLSVSGVAQNIEESWQPQVFNQPAPTSFFDENPRVTNISVEASSPPRNGSHDSSGPRGLKIIVIDSQLSDSFIDSSLRHIFARHPYDLTIGYLQVNNGTAYITFLEGIDRVLAEPLKTLLGCPIDCEAIPLEAITALQNLPKVLLIKSLPDMKEDRIKRALERLFKNVGHAIEKSVVKGKEVYVTFKDVESVKKLVDNPPDSSMIAGHPVIYTTAKEEDMLEDEEKHHMLIVDNLPDEWDEDLDEDFITFMSRTSHFPIKSFEVKDGKGYVHYANPDDAKKVAKAPPSNTFYGKNINFRAQPLDVSQSVPAGLFSMSPSDKKEIGEGGLLPPSRGQIKTSPAASPVPKPRGISDIIVKGLPADLDKQYLQLYLEDLPIGLECEDIQLKDDATVVKLKNKIDIKSLQQSIRESPFPDDDIVLTVEPLKTSNKTTTKHSIDYSDGPPPPSHYSNSSDTIIIKELPFGVKEFQLRIYFKRLLNLIGKAKCVDIQIRKDENVAIVKMDRKIDVKALRQKAMKSPLPEGPLFIEPYSSPLHSPNNTKQYSGDKTKQYSGNKTKQYSGDMETSLPAKAHLTKTIVVREIPPGVKDYVVKMYLTSLSGAQCEDIQMNDDTAIVTFDREIDIKSLRRKLLDFVFPEGNVVLNIESHKPSTSVLISPDDKLPVHVLEMYCDEFGEVQIDKKNDSYVVTFEERVDQQKFLRQQKHTAGNHKFTATHYNPLLNKHPSSSRPHPPSPSSVPPPIPPRKAYYTWPNCKVTIPPEAHKYFLHFQKSINEELLTIEGELSVFLKTLEVKPLGAASEIEDWETQVRCKIETYKQDFLLAKLDLPLQGSPRILDYLADMQVRYPDLHYTPHGNNLTLAGHTETVRNLTDDIQKMLSEEIEITYKLEKPPRYIQYILKFARSEIMAIQPPVEFEYKENNPGTIILRGVKKSTEKVRILSETKINQAHTEIIPLTTSAYELLQGQRGKMKMKEVLKDLDNSVFYMCEKTDQFLDYQYQLSILSPDSVACHSAKRTISCLIEEKRIHLSPDEINICISQEWLESTNQITLRYFVKVTPVNDTVLLTGEVTCLREVSEQISTFLQKRNTVNDKVVLSKSSWQLISRLKKVKDVQKYAKSRNVKVTLPDSFNNTQEQVLIELSGEPRALEDVKTRFKMLMDEVNQKTFNIRPQPGLEKVVEKGMIRVKCHQLEHEHKMVITYTMEEVVDSPLTSTVSISTGPLRVLSGNSLNGIKVQVYTGDYTKKRCGALGVFVSEAPRDNHPILASLAVAGGTDVQGSLKVLSLKPHLIEATVQTSKSVGNLDCVELCYVVCPVYDSSNPDPSVIVDVSIQVLLDKVAMIHPDILLTPLTAPPHKYPVEIYAQSVLRALSTANLGIYNDVQVTIFIEKEEDKDVFHKNMKELGYVIDYVHTSQGKRRGNTTSLAGGIKVQILQGDVTKTHCNVLVNSTAVDMRYNSNTISKAIHTAAGNDLRKACQSLVDQGVLLKDGNVVPTIACGSLRCNKVFHAHVPGKLVNVPATPDQTKKLKTVIANCLKMADEDGDTSLAMPAFCLGIGNFSVPESAKPTLEAIQEFSQTKVSHLKDIQIVILDQRMYQQYRDWSEAFFTSLGLPITKIDSSKGSEGISTTLNIAGTPGGSGLSRGRLDTSAMPSLQPATKKYKLTFQLHSLSVDTLEHAETEIIKYMNELIVDDMVDLGEMTSLLSESDIQNIYQFANREGVEITIDRRLNRILVNGEERAVEKVCNQIQMNIVELSRLLQELHMFEWMARNADGTVEKYNLEAAQQLEVAYKRRQEIIKLKIDDIECTINLYKMEEKENVAGTTKTIMRTRKAYVEYPSNWDLAVLGSNEVVYFIDIPETSGEYIKATNRFLDTIGCQCDIAKVQRVQNPSEYTRYQSLKNTWVMLHNVENVAEKELFHGTKQDKITPICSTGFNRGYAADSNAARYGKGVYFALNASYSMQDKYSTADKDGYKYILVCSLLVCKMTVGNEKIKVPPPTPENPQVLYDTLVERLTNPTIFVAMKDSQAYPKYVIMFKKRL